MSAVLGIIGHDRAVTRKMARAVHREVAKLGDYTPMTETERGYRFDVKAEVDGAPTGHVVRVTVELDRLEQGL